MVILVFGSEVPLQINLFICNKTGMDLGNFLEEGIFHESLKMAKQSVHNELIGNRDYSSCKFSFKTTVPEIF